MESSKFTTHDVKKCCENKLDIVFREAKEFNGWFRMHTGKIARITIPKGRKPIPRKTYKSMANQLKISIQQFDDLLECPLGKEGYIEIVST